MLLLQLVAAVLILVIKAYLCQERVCIYDDVNLCSNCTVSLHVRNVSAIPDGNGLMFYFCSTRIIMDAELVLKDREYIGIRGVERTVRIECVRNTSAGILFSNVTNIKVEELALVKCGMFLYNTTASARELQSIKGSLCIINSCNVTISEVTISRSAGVGLSLLNTAGTVNIENCVFEYNQVPKENAQNTIGGGGLYIEMSQNTDRCKGSVYQIRDCQFQNNSASATTAYISSLESDNMFSNRFQNLGRGGGVSITMSGVAVDNIVNISSCNFHCNSALWGGGVYAMFHGSAESNQLIISDANFTHNNSPERGGGGIAIGVISLADLAPGSLFKTLNNQIKVVNCHFHHNNASFGGGMALYATESSDFLPQNNSIEFHDCCWENNTAFLGAAIDLSSHIWSEARGSLPSTKFVNCLFQFNSISHNEQAGESHRRHTKGKAVFYSVGYKVDFSEKTFFRFNKGSALYLVSSNVHFSKGSIVEFTANKGFSGGAITMLGFSALNIRDNTSFLFDSNTARDRGGAIRAVTINKKDFIATTACFIEYSSDITEEHSRNPEFVFRNNSAGTFGRSVAVDGHYGHSIFASSFEPCRRHCTSNYVHLNVSEIDCIAKFTFQDKIKYDVATSGKEIKLTENAVLPLRVVPGKLTELPIIMTDEFNQEISDLYHVQVRNLNHSQVTLDYSDAYISEKLIRLYGVPGDMAEITIETTNILEIGITFRIQVQQCPPGFVLVRRLVANREVSTCACSASTSDKRYPGIHRCNDTEFVSLLTKGYWIGYDQMGEFGDEGHLLSAYCPSGYCSTNNAAYTTEKEFKLPQNTSIQVLNRFICTLERTGILCGRCVENYTSYYNSRSFKCRETGKCNWGWLFFILSEIVPITLLFVAIMVFNIKLTTGAFNAFLYFAQVSDTLLITANGFIIFPYHTYTFVRINSLIYRMFNLNFFAMEELSFCLWKSAHTLDLLIFKYVTIIYALILVFIIIVFMRFCNCTSKNAVISKMRRKKRSARSTIIHGLTGFLVMCYSEGTRISLLLLTPVLLQTSSQSGSSYIKQVVFYNGEISFFGGTHLLYALPALFFLIILGVIPPILLISYPLCYKIFALLRISETKFVSILCKCVPLESLRPLFDSFQSSFRDNCRFFAGLYFLYRLAFLCSFAFLHNLNEFYLAAQAQLVLILAVHAIVQPYKKHWHNVVDALIFMILTIINAMTLFNYKHASELLDYKHVIHIVSKIQTALLHVPLVYMVVYIAVILWYQKQAIRRLIQKVRRKPKKKVTKDRRLVTTSVVANTDDSIDFLDSDYHHRKEDTEIDRF